MSSTFDIQNPQSWPDDVKSFLKENQEFILGRNCTCCNTEYDPVYEDVYRLFQEILKKYSLIGFHCTKLVEAEIREIQNNGMSLQNLNSLSKRIDVLLDLGLIDSEVAQILKTQNNANEQGRAKMLWFCFYPPHFAGRSGIQGFFNFWGGEALFGSHEYDPISNSTLESGIELQKIGIPCIVKAKVPMSFLSEYCLPVQEMFSAQLKSKGHCIDISLKHEGYSIRNIPPDNILELIEYPTQEFVNLTKCDEWWDYVN